MSLAAPKSSILTPTANRALEIIARLRHSAVNVTSAGTAGAAGTVGYPGASGMVVVKEHYQ